MLVFGSGKFHDRRFSYFAALTILRHEAFESAAFDLGIMDQAAWNTLRGNIMGVTIETEKTTTHLGYHFDPIMIPVSRG